MGQVRHGSATITHAVKAAIQRSQASTAALSREAIEDETTLPIRHTMAPSEMTVPVERLDNEFFELAAAEGVTDIDELNKVLDRAVGLRTFLTADGRIEKVAAFVAEHFREKVHPLGYKAFLVGVNREACAKYKRECWQTNANRLHKDRMAVPYAAQSARHSARATARLALKSDLLERLRSVLKRL